MNDSGDHRAPWRGTLPELFVERTRRHRTDEIGKAFCETGEGLPRKSVEL
jgi:hypothetical protein